MKLELEVRTDRPDWPFIFRLPDTHMNCIKSVTQVRDEYVIVTESNVYVARPDGDAFTIKLLGYLGC